MPFERLPICVEGFEKARSHPGNDAFILTKFVDLTSPVFANLSTHPCNLNVPPLGVVRSTTKQGVVSFPLTINKAKTGNYVLKFQAERSGAKVSLTSPPFYVVNRISEVKGSSEIWQTLEVDNLDESTMLPKQPQFKVSTLTNQSLSSIELHWGDFFTMVKGGIQV